MTHSLDVLLVARKKEPLDALEQHLRVAGVSIRRQMNSNGHADPLHYVEQPPDVLILHLSHLWREELEAVAARHLERKTALIVVGASSDMGMMRLAMQAGARDLLPEPVVKNDLLIALERVKRERQTQAQAAQGTIAAFVNAQGGCGATLLACNVAHMLAAESKKRTTLLDLGLQFGAAPLYLDLFPQRGVWQAMENLDGLDEVALEGYFTRHTSGLHVLSHGADEPIETRELSLAAVERLLEVALRAHDHLVVDLPRRVDGVLATVVQRSQQVVVVLQQSVTALRDATRLLQWLRGEGGVARDRLCIVVNRYDKGAPISAADIQKALGCDEPVLVPNDFRMVSECINSGTPLLEHARGAAITKAVMSLQTRLGGASTRPRAGVLARTFSNLLSGGPK
jgi:Flp pilus assembly protein, ATPase CpaE